MNVNHAIWLNLETLQDFLKEHGRGSQTKDYEIVTAIFLAKFCEEQFRKECEVGFPLKNALSKDIPSRSFDQMDEIADILRNAVEEDTPIDVIITPETDIFNRNRKGVLFQLKRFGKGIEDGTEALIEYLNVKIKKKYAPTTGITLVLMMECTYMDTVKLRKEFIRDNFPFERLMFVALSKDKKFQIGEFWPNEGVTEYDSSIYL